MINFFKDVLKANNTIKAVTAAAILLWLVTVVTFFSTFSDYRLRSHFDQAKAAYLLGDKPRAVSELNAALDIDGSLSQAYVLAGKIAFENKNYEDANQYFESAATRGEYSAGVQNAVAVTRIIRNLGTGAIDSKGRQMLKQAAETSPYNGDAYVSLGSVYLYEDDVDEAEAAYQKALETGNVSYDGLIALYNGLGVIEAKKSADASALTRSTLLKKAEEEFHKSEYLAPESIDVLANKVILQFALAADKPLGHPDRKVALQRAKDYMTTTTEATEFAYVFHHNAALWYYSQKEYAKAIREAEKAIDIRPTEEIDQFNRVTAALAYARQQKDKAMVESVGKMIFTLTTGNIPDEDMLRLYGELAALEYAAGMADSAEDHFRKAEKLIGQKTPKETAAKIYRGLALVTFNKSVYKECLAYVKKARNADPSMQDILAVEERLSAAPSVSHLTRLERDYLIDSYPAIRATVYNRSSSEPLGKSNISVMFGDTPGVFAFTNNSSVVAVPERPLPEGAHIAKLTATDDLGNKAESTESIIIDRTPPYAVVSPDPKAPLSGMYPLFTINLKDDTTPIDFRTIKLAVIYHRDDGRVENYVLVQDGKFTDRVSLDLAGGYIKDAQFSFELKTRLRPGKLTYVLTAADKRGNKMDDFQWTYNVKGGEEN